MGPGAYLPDRTEGITRVEDLPSPVFARRSRNYRHRPLPTLRPLLLPRDGRGGILHDLGFPLRDRPRRLQVVYSKHYCAACRARTSTPTWRTWLRPAVTTPAGSSAWRPGSAVEDGLPYRTASWHLWRDHRVFVPFPTIQNWIEAAGKKSAAHAETDYLDWALADFSGYLAADELYDGPFCVLSAVDARQQRRLLYEVLDHDPTQADILLFLAQLHEQIVARGHTVLGITTDGSSLYPAPHLPGVWGYSASGLRVPRPQGIDQGRATRTCSFCVNGWRSRLRSCRAAARRMTQRRNDCVARHGLLGNV